MKQNNKAIAPQIHSKSNASKAVEKGLKHLKEVRFTLTYEHIEEALQITAEETEKKYLGLLGVKSFKEAKTYLSKIKKELNEIIIYLKYLKEK